MLKKYVLKVNIIGEVVTGSNYCRCPESLGALFGPLGPIGGFK